MSVKLFPFSTARTPSFSRIGPHNIDILSIIFGSLLGSAHLEKDGHGVCFAFFQSISHAEFLLWLHSKISSLGYCKSAIPQIHSRLHFDGSLRYSFRFRTFTFSSFLWIYDAFYLSHNSIKRKIVPSFLSSYLTPLALAVWIMDDGSYIPNKGLKFSTNSFTLDEVKFLGSILSDLYSVSFSIHKTGAINQYNLYLPKKSFDSLIPIVQPYFHPSMYYKLGL